MSVKRLLSPLLGTVAATIAKRTRTLNIKASLPAHIQWEMSPKQHLPSKISIAGNKTAS
eukprot:CAMPEP_0177262818 /NCGR_PEP_ID=MMETSP0367-20130122/60630_1 /TAXON_ID=447022 ORGANISM="Scrippsiella hangoei-like, Strain SHHI-4" /NCGR_SAMPLE_ID=MMETSP0367 /ASSEMBLY_ACC=CAM_ASM_000362 /LENGTH=58 /DNA_ID=CAMNT_0018717699 /DNA_START=75 /DNA_END=251 /DNA_ORIENTATION=-